jgi:hypothetical protein
MSCQLLDEHPGGKLILPPRSRLRDFVCKAAMVQRLDLPPVRPPRSRKRNESSMRCAKPYDVSGRGKPREGDDTQSPTWDWMSRSGSCGSTSKSSTRRSERGLRGAERAGRSPGTCSRPARIDVIVAAAAPVCSHHNGTSPRPIALRVRETGIRIGQRFERIWRSRAALLAIRRSGSGSASILVGP